MTRSEARIRHGEWLVMDGGALRVRAYLKGTAHLEVHPEMAAAKLHSGAPVSDGNSASVPPETEKKLKDFTLMDKPLPFAVLAVLSGLKAEHHNPRRRNKWDDPTPPLTTNPFNRRFDWQDEDKAIRGQAGKVLEMIGGVLIKAAPRKISTSGSSITTHPECSVRSLHLAVFQTISRTSSTQPRNRWPKGLYVRPKYNRARNAWSQVLAPGTSLY